jgi:hypothetical protein
MLQLRYFENTFIWKFVSITLQLAYCYPVRKKVKINSTYCNRFDTYRLLFGYAVPNHVNNDVILMYNSVAGPACPPQQKIHQELYLLRVGTGTCHKRNSERQTNSSNYKTLNLTVTNQIP